MNTLPQSQKTADREYEVIRHAIIKDFKISLVQVHFRTAHMHSDIEVGFLLEGEAEVSCSGETIHLHAPDFYVVNPFEMHETRSEEGALFISLQVLSSFFRDYYPAIGAMRFRFCSGAEALCHPGQPYLERIFAFALSIGRHYYRMEEGFSLYCAGKLNHLFYDLIQLLPWTTVTAAECARKEQTEQRLRSITAYIHEHYDEKLLLSDLAQQEKLSLSYLSHFFSEHFHMSFQAYLLRLRCEKARQLLLQTDLNLLEICMECGISDIKYLKNGFAKLYGIQPAVLRQLGTTGEADADRSRLSLQRFLPPEEALTYLNAYRIP